MKSFNSVCQNVIKSDLKALIHFTKSQGNLHSSSSQSDKSIAIALKISTKTFSHPQKHDGNQIFCLLKDLSKKAEESFILVLLSSQDRGEL
ncbi:CLUMA_CG010774, isoform A [Clunio marinus]|uniref:CLUMA_CG010774, isoform A n=1 Tax=Clunio marinus TaxID=568069 RepID=A0A1J1IAW7_9DIPT|nr:CLUMA_CG010774, isoform A [Clunio marinus]